MRYAGGFEAHFSQITAPFVGIPQILQKGLCTNGTRDWQFEHHRLSIFPQPQTGGKRRSIPLQANRQKRYDHGIFFTGMVITFLLHSCHDLDGGGGQNDNQNRWEHEERHRDHHLDWSFMRFLFSPLTTFYTHLI